MIDKKYHFCTMFDYHYLSRGLALYHSLKSNCPQANLWILCLDVPTYSLLNSFHLPDVYLIDINEVEIFDKELAESKLNRSCIEYYFTCNPALFIYVFHITNNIELLTYVDADLFFYSEPNKYIDEISNYSISITPHRFQGKIKYLEDKYGIFNIGWVTIKKDNEGLSCLNRWRKQNIEWCHDRFDNGRYADQMYLNDWPDRFDRVKIINHKGINLALFNLANFNLTLNNKVVYVDEYPLICYHFFGLKNFLKLFYYFPIDKYNVKPSRVLTNYIYEPYLKSLSTIQNELKSKIHDLNTNSSIRSEFFPNDHHQNIFLKKRIAKILTLLSVICSSIVHKRFLFFYHNRIRI